ncbi:MAG TPA: G8 domain-containing protein [Casimicrobiaceae bacterium]|nr:G8 domain-containing protein [Casimicrobiaceae bacterium]
MSHLPSILLRGALAASFAFLSAAALAAHSSEATPCGTRAEPKLAPGGNGNDLWVKDGTCTVAEGTYNYGAVTIYPGGKLEFSDANIDLTVKSIVIQGGGSMSTPTAIGTGNRSNKVVIRFVGTRPAVSALMHSHAHADAVVAGADDCSVVEKGIAVMSGGKLNLAGRRGVAADDGKSATIGGPNPGTVSWTYLAKPAGPAKYQATDAGIGSPVDTGGEKTIAVAANVAADWLPGDWIVIGTTSYSPFESEFVKIAAGSDAITFANGVTTIKLDATTPLRQYHFGGPDPGRPSLANASADKTTNYGVDERAEVGLVSRNVLLTAKMPDASTSNDTKNLAWGGETRFCKGFAEAKLSGVEIEKFGKDQLGSYPIHLHMAGDVASGTALFNSNSIHHSYNHCITIHETNNVTFSNNVCARIIGHVFYEEKMKDKEGSSAIALTGLKFHDNLALGAMANGFNIGGVTPITIDGKSVYPNFWEGDYLSRSGDGYYGLLVPNTDDQTLAVHGSCFEFNKAGSPTGSLSNPLDPPCQGANLYYFEPPSGFWVVNPATEMTGNSVGGCQSIGKAFWYVPPVTITADRQQLMFQPVGKFVNNRAHGCFDGIFGETDTGVKSQQLFPKVDGNLVNLNLFARFDAFTASRIRNRGVWMRPSWFVFEHARVATSREGVTLVTSGGLDGNSPGVWGLLKNSTIIGVSRNNVDRWGPCNNKNDQEGKGCVDWNPQSITVFEKGYASPAWNFAGFYIYDGPARIHDTRFVNFQVDPRKELLTSDDTTILNNFTSYFGAKKVYEGDAALGWFQNNQSAYPTATDVRGLKFEGTDLRHQVFTEQVNFGTFDDGDKNTAVIDRDGSLTGFKVVGSSGGALHEQYPISLNNLPINAASNAVDECHAEGGQDTPAEGRPTSLISPGNYGTLEFEAFSLPDGNVPANPPPNAPPNRLTQWVTFTKDTTDYGAHQSMSLHSRNNQGIWEPKVANKHGYTVTARAATEPAYSDTRRDPGFPRLVSVGVNDIVMPGISATNPFYVRVGVCYTNKDGTHPDGNFEIKRGWRSWGGGNVDPNSTELRKLYIQLNTEYQDEQCFNLAAQNPQILNDTVKGCPAHGITPAPDSGTCPPGSVATTQRNNFPVCAFTPTTLQKVTSLRDLTNADGTPKSLDSWFYDKTTGMLFFYVKQDRPNALASSPLGSCPTGTSDSACPNPNDATYPESYYACPPEGCPTYNIRLSASTPYDPGPSACTTADPTSIYTANPDYAQAPIPGQNQLAFVVPAGTTPPPSFLDGDVVEAKDDTSRSAFPHRLAAFKGSAVSPVCPGTPTGVSFNALGTPSR